MQAGAPGELLVLPLILPLGDAGLLVRFGNALSAEANRRAVALARGLGMARVTGVVEIAPNLISVLVRFDPRQIGFEQLAGEVRLLVSTDLPAMQNEAATHVAAVHFGGEDGPDFEAAAAALGMTGEAFAEAHNVRPLQVLATGFAPGFVYCGFHPEALVLPRRSSVRPPVPAGSVLFAAGQTAITSTPIPTGWHVIGRTSFRNFDPEATPPTRLEPGDLVQFKVAM